MPGKNQSYKTSKFIVCFMEQSKLKLLVYPYLDKCILKNKNTIDEKLNYVLRRLQTSIFSLIFLALSKCKYKGKYFFGKLMAGFLIILGCLYTYDM